VYYFKHILLFVSKFLYHAAYVFCKANRG